MEKLKVAVLFGGCSSEYSVSLVSGTSVLRNLNKDKYDISMIGITKQGDFYLYNGELDAIEKDDWQHDDKCQKITFSTNRSDHGFIIIDTNTLVKIDIAFPVLHGRNGEDGRLQGLFELAGIPFVGCDMSASLICMDKYLAHELAALKGITVPKAYTFSNYEKKEDIKEKLKDLPYPMFVKPLKAGSSYGISKVNNEDELDKAIDFAFKYDQKIIIEENIDGFEVGCAIMGNGNDLIIGEVDEIEIHTDFYNFEEKYTALSSKIILPARLSDTEKENIKKTALTIYKSLGCKGVSRVDMFYTKDKKIVFNEVNTMPGFTSHSRYPSMLKAIGYDFSAVLDNLIQLGVKNEQD